MVIRRVNPLSAAKIAGLLYAVIGLVIGACFSLIFGAIGTLGAERDVPPMFGVLFGAGSIILLPLFYGVMGFVTTAIAAVIYNLLAGVVGGVEIDVDGVTIP